MSETERIDRIREQIFSAPEGLKVYGVLDGASADRLPQAIYQHGVDSVCLLRGELEPDLAQVAPYLVRLDPGAPFTGWVLEEGWGNHWGIFVVTKADVRTLRQHFRSFLTVYDPDNVPLFFRYYDPRVLRVYLPTCNAEELETVFGPVERYLMEGKDDQSLLRCEFKEGALVCG
jgi:hypothetical protein